MTLTHSLGPPLLPQTPQRLLQTTCRLPCLPITPTGFRTTVLRRQAHLVRPNRFLDQPQVNLARSHCPSHLPKTRTRLRSEGQVSHNLAISRTTVSQTSRPKRRDRRPSHSSLNNHNSRRHCSKSRMDRNHPRVRLLLLNNPRLNHLRSSVVPRARDNNRSFSNSNRFNLSSSHHSLVSNQFNHSINHLRRCNSRNSHSSSNRLRERIRSQIWLDCSSPSWLAACSGLGYQWTSIRLSISHFTCFLHWVEAGLLCVYEIITAKVGGSMIL